MTSFVIRSGHSLILKACRCIVFGLQKRSREPLHSLPSPGKPAQILTERWRLEYNTERPHSALGYRPPAPQAILPKQPGHGDMENAARFPHPHTPGGDYRQMSDKALH
jgi:transposase InsO family protein